MKACCVHLVFTFWIKKFTTWFIYLKEKAPEKPPAETQEQEQDGISQEQQSQDTSEQENPKQEAEPAGKASQTETKVSFIVRHLKEKVIYDHLYSIWERDYLKRQFLEVVTKYHTLTLEAELNGRFVLK